ncbi:MAG: hypothetical protein M3Z17_01400 [Gemmatimonadota bacterium]|nr:hypothetical protein [Gemmatimonadota bacterium]
MAHRIFADSSGASWLVLAVYPSSEERRSHRERRSGQNALDPEPRRKGVRRQVVRRTMQKGWLVFKGPLGRRRLTPILKGWETCPVQDLERLLQKAMAARRSSDPRRG